VLLQVPVHVVGVPEQVRLVSPALLETLEFRAVEVVGQDWLVIWVCALLDDLPGSLGWRHTCNASQTLFCDHNVQIVFGLVDVGDLVRR